MIDLDAIKARLALATPGPWRVKEQDRANIHRGTVEVEESAPSLGLEVVAECYCGAYEGHGLRNADLIAHAPEDLAALIEEVRYLRGERAAVAAWLRECALGLEATGAEGQQKSRQLELFTELFERSGVLALRGETAYGRT